MKNMYTGKLERIQKFKDRYNKALAPRFGTRSNPKGSNHNWLRIRRILAHLIVAGFRRYAIELVSFLEKEIYGYEGFYS